MEIDLEDTPIDEDVQDTELEIDIEIDFEDASV